MLFDAQTLKTLDALTIATKRRFAGSRLGAHRSASRGQGMEFAEYRPYVLGDNPRSIDWSVFGRTEKLYVKTFQEERKLSVLIHLDCSNSMRVSRAWSFGVMLALSLAYIGIREGENVVFSTSISATSGRVGAVSQLMQISEKLLNAPLNPTSESHEEAELLHLRRTLANLRTPGVGVIISDYLFPSATTSVYASEFTRRSFDLTGFNIGPSNVANEPLRHTVIDSEAGLAFQSAVDHTDYLNSVRTHWDGVRDIFERAGAKFITCKPDEELIPFLNRCLSRAGILR